MEKSTMKTRRTFLAVTALLLIGSFVGCATFNGPAVRLAARGLASGGGILLLEKKPDARPKIAKVVKALEGVASLETGTLEDLQKSIEGAFGDGPAEKILAADLASLVDMIRASILH